MTDDCIFCMLSKSGPHMVFEDKICYVVLDRYPSDYGHMLVISKEHHLNILEAPDETVKHMFVIAKRFGLASREKHNAKGVIISTNSGKEGGQVIFHFHIHIVPKYSEKKKGFMPHKELTHDESRDLIELLKS